MLKIEIINNKYRLVFVGKDMNFVAWENIAYQMGISELKFLEIASKHNHTKREMLGSDFAIYFLCKSDAKNAKEELESVSMAYKLAGELNV